MTDREKVIKGMEHEISRANIPTCGTDFIDCVEVALLCDALALLKAQEPQYPVCEKCGKTIDHINTSVFHYEGTDSEYQIPIIFDERTGCVVFETTRNWTGYELTDKERKDGIRCPHCGEYPFDSSIEIEFHEPVEVLMWTPKQTDPQRYYEAAVEMEEYCERYEPTYNPEDGSM